MMDHVYESWSRDEAFLRKAFEEHFKQGSEGARKEATVSKAAKKTGARGKRRSKAPEIEYHKVDGRRLRRFKNAASPREAWEAARQLIFAVPGTWDKPAKQAVNRGLSKALGLTK